MPAYDIDSQSPGGSFEHQPSDGWSMPMGRIAGIRLFVSYSVFVALAVLAGLVAMLCNREGNQDLPLVALMSVVIWIIGWSVQTIVQLAMHFGSSARSESITIGLLGIETPNPLFRQYPWSAVANLTAACLSLTALMLFGAASLAIHMLTHGLDLSDASLLLSELATPSFGLDAVDNGYLTATWLFWIQAACQAYPLPRNMGRGAVASAVALFTAEANDDFQVRLLRCILQLIAIITLLIAMATMIAETTIFLPRWPILALLSAFLWFSTKKHDLRDWITSVHLANADPVARQLLWESSETDEDPVITSQLATPQQPASPRRPITRRSIIRLSTTWYTRWIDSIRMQRKRRLARAALRREREEADDAARLDEVLQLVSEKGIDGLNADDRALLQRVSTNLRRHREHGDDSAGPPQALPEE